MQQSDLKWRLDFVSCDMKRIRRGVPIPMDHGENQYEVFFMLISVHERR